MSPFIEPIRHRGRNRGRLAIVYPVLFMAGLAVVSGFGILFGEKPPWFPGPWEPASVITAYFQGHPTQVLICASLQFGAMIPLGIYVATVVSRLRFLGVTAAGPYIALFGGFLTVFNSSISHLVMWTMTRPDIAHNAPILPSLYFLAYVFGGPGFSVLMGLLIACVTVTAGFRRLLPKWIVVFGLVLAAAGELSWLHLLLFPKFLFLIPLTRFPGFIWLIAAGFAMPVARGSVPG